MGNKENLKYYDEKDFKRIKLHFKYVGIIFILFTTLILSYVFFDKNGAWQFLSFAGVSLSIVLSVIAILITLIDVAGQKQQVNEIFKSSEELKETISKQKLLIQKHVENINNVDDMLNNAFERNLKDINFVREKSDGDSDIEKDEKNKDNSTPSIATNYYSESWFSSVFKTIRINKELTLLQEDEIIKILSEFKFVKVKFYSDKIELVYSSLYTSPLVDKEYMKNRASNLILRYLNKENLLMSSNE